MNPNSGTRARPLALFSITIGWGVRNFTYTQVFETVSNFADIGVAVSKELLPYFQDLKAQGKIAMVMELPSAEPLGFRIIRLAKKAILQAGCDISTARIKWGTRASGPFSKCFWSVLWGLQKALFRRWQIKALESIEVFLSRFDSFCCPHAPTIVVNCSPFDFRDNRLSRLMHLKGIPVLEIIPSWDNPSTKGTVHTFADRILAWGGNQKSELLDFYPCLLPKQISISGMPQFDTYYQELPQEYSRVPFLERLGINPSSKVILYATCSERLFPSEPEVVRCLAEAVVNNRYGEGAHLLIRCHPADREVRYKDLCSSGRVTIYPHVEKEFGSFYKWIPPGNELLVLAASLRHSDVCVNTASTMTIDAFACGKPVVNVGYDGKEALPYLKSVQRYYDYHHYRPILRSGAVPIAKSRQELVDMVLESLVNPGRLQEKRKDVLNSLCFHPSEGSGMFIANEIKSIILG